MFILILIFTRIDSHVHIHINIHSYW